MSDDTHAERSLKPAPRGWMLLLALGPGLMWCGEYIGTGEIILSTRSGALFGVALLWVPVVAIFAKFWIGLAGAHYTVTTGEGMIDMLSRTPGPRNWVLWPVFVGQISAAAISTAAVASAAGAFAAHLIPLSQTLLAWLACLLIIALVWSGVFNLLKQAMSLLVLIIIIGTIAVVVRTWPGFGDVASGLFGFQIPPPPAWASDGGASSPWLEILPLLGWAAGGFASQVWYTYWVIGAGYGMSRGRGYGNPADTERLQQVSDEEAQHIRAWRRVVSLDALTALVIGIVVTSAFMMAGAGILHPRQQAPEGADVAITLSQIFSENWGQFGATLFLLAGLAALLSTMLGQFAGWPRLLADCARLLIPGVSKWSWKAQFRVVLVLFAFSNMVIVYTLGLKPVFLVQVSAVLDGLLLTPLQALAVAWVLYRVMPTMFPERLRPTLRPHPIFAVGLAFAFLLFAYVCIFRIGDYF